MPKVNITQAAKLVGISRTTLYKTYIKTGEVSVSKNYKGHKEIDTSELLRVFGELKNEQVNSADERSGEQYFTPGTEQVEQLVCIAELETENRLLKEHMSELKEQQQIDRDQIKDLSTKLLKHDPPSRNWWQFWR